MTTYASLTEALDDLRRRGYTEDFDLRPNGIECAAMELELHPDDFEIVEVYRFEGVTNPDDSQVVYAIVGKNNVKGVLVDASGRFSTDRSDGPELFVEMSPGTAPPEVVAELLSDISLIYRKMGGSGINFSLQGITVSETSDHEI